MFFIITVNLARYALSELEAIMEMAQAKVLLHPPACKSYGLEGMYLFFDILLFLSISIFVIFAVVVSFRMILSKA